MLPQAIQRCPSGPLDGHGASFINQCLQPRCVERGCAQGLAHYLLGDALGSLHRETGMPKDLERRAQQPGGRFRLYAFSERPGELQRRRGCFKRERGTK